MHEADHKQECVCTKRPGPHMTGPGGRQKQREIQATIRGMVGVPKWRHGGQEEGPPSESELRKGTADELSREMMRFLNPIW